MKNLICLLKKAVRVIGVWLRKLKGLYMAVNLSPLGGIVGVLLYCLF